jgi:general stress protein YciG
VNRHGENALAAMILKTLETTMAPKSSNGGAKRGFAAMSPEKQREIASKGGKASHGGGRKSTRLI